VTVWSPQLSSLPIRLYAPAYHVVRAIGTMIHEKQCTAAMLVMLFLMLALQRTAEGKWSGARKLLSLDVTSLGTARQTASRLEQQTNGMIVTRYVFADAATPTATSDCVEKHMRVASRFLRSIEFAECNEPEAPPANGETHMDWHEFANLHMRVNPPVELHQAEPPVAEAPQADTVKPHEIHQALKQVHVMLHTNLIKAKSAFLRRRERNARQW
jgi:hypothetical protein